MDAVTVRVRQVRGGCVVEWGERSIPVDGDTDAAHVFAACIEAEDLEANGGGWLHSDGDGIVRVEDC